MKEKSVEDRVCDIRGHTRKQLSMVTLPRLPN